MNVAAIRGRVLRPPTDRELGSGLRLVSIDVGVAYEEGPEESVEVVWADPPAAGLLPRQGTEIVAIGRVRRRFFRTQAGATVSRTELVADTVLTARQASRIKRRLEILVEDVTA
jgi:hypothetical protein